MKAAIENKENSEVNLTFIEQKKVFVGSKQMQIKDPLMDVVFQVLVHYPTYQPSSPTAFGPYIMGVCTDADIIEGQFRLLSYRTVMVAHIYSIAQLVHI